MVRPARSSSRKVSQLAHLPTRFELAIRTRGAHSCVRKTPTGLPDWTSSVSSFSKRRNSRTMASKASQERAARPVPPYTTRSSGRSATSGSRLFISIRSAASRAQPLQPRSGPRGARTARGPEWDVGPVSIVIVASEGSPGQAWVLPGSDPGAPRQCAPVHSERHGMGGEGCDEPAASVDSRDQRPADVFRPKLIHRDHDPIAALERVDRNSTATRGFVDHEVADLLLAGARHAFGLRAGASGVLIDPGRVDVPVLTFGPEVADGEVDPVRIADVTGRCGNVAVKGVCRVGVVKHLGLAARILSDRQRAGMRWQLGKQARIDAETVLAGRAAGPRRWSDGHGRVGR